MASLGQLTTSALSGTLDTTVALANFNFNFTLCKVEAPKEFDGVGAQLSDARRQDAEFGPSHITARKLGALFEGLIPPTPSLIRAYGVRASEISKSIPRGDDISHGFFTSRIDADTTSIWAAAPSGKAALATHLLACMLARIWEGPEATAIWVEITSKRKAEIIDKFEESSMADIGAMTAAEETFTRSELANWDSKRPCLASRSR